MGDLLLYFPLNVRSLCNLVCIKNKNWMICSSMLPQLGSVFVHIIWRTPFFPGTLSSEPLNHSRCRGAQPAPNTVPRSTHHSKSATNLLYLYLQHKREGIWAKTCSWLWHTWDTYTRSHTRLGTIPKQVVLYSTLKLITVFHCRIVVDLRSSSQSCSRLNCQNYWWMKKGNMLTAHSNAILKMNSIIVVWFPELSNADQSDCCHTKVCHVLYRRHSCLLKWKKNQFPINWRMTHCYFNVIYLKPVRV